MVCGKLASRRRRRRSRCAQVDNYKWVQFNQNIIRSHTLFRSLALLGFFSGSVVGDHDDQSILHCKYPSWFGCIGRSVAAQECAPWCFAIQNRSQLDLTNNYSKWSCFPSPRSNWSSLNCGDQSTIQYARHRATGWLSEMRSWTRRRRNKFFTSLNRSSPKQNPSIDRSIKSIEIIIIISNY